MLASLPRARACRGAADRVSLAPSRSIARSAVLGLLVSFGGACSGAPHAPPEPLETLAPASTPSPTASAAAAAAAPSPRLFEVAPVAAPTTPANALVVAKGDPGAPSTFPVFTDPGELPSLHVERADGDAFALEHTDVRAALSSTAADVEITQTFQNPKDHPIEAVYVFPLPENAAVHEMRLTVGDRVVSSVVEERRAARRTYDAAKAQGFTAALLEQERSNVFTQSVANIEPGKKVEVTIRYTEDLTYDAGTYELVFPMVVGPRFIAGTPLAASPKGAGTKRDTNRVPDASRITPPYRRVLKPGKDVSIEVVAPSSVAVGPFEVPTHKVVAKRESDGALDVRLADDDAPADRDFVMRYRVAAEEPRSTMIVDRDAGFFSLMIAPPNVDVESLVGHRELVFVVDVSGSMKGVPLARCKEAMRDALSRLRPVDTFNILTFSGHTGKAFPEPRRANDAAVREALSFVDRMKAGGSTEMLDAVGAALSPEVDEGRNRYVFFMTDGYVGEEDQIMRSTGRFVSAIEGRGKRAEVFGFGVGASPNRALLDGLSRAGKGVAVYASNREDPGRAVNQFFRYIDKSVLRDVKVDFGASAVDDVMPRELPDLFASRPLVVHGRLHGAVKGPIVVRATSARGAITIPVEVADMPKEDGLSTREGASKRPRAGLLGTLWARSKVGWLEGDLVEGSPTAQADITRLGLDYGLVTRFTSFVAVDWTKRVGSGAPESVAVPVAVPEGVDATSSGATGDKAPAPPEEEIAKDRKGEAPAPEPTEAYAAPPSLERGPRGCACTLGGGEGGDDASIASLAACVVLAAALRRSRRRTNCAP